MAHRVDGSPRTSRSPLGLAGGSIPTRSGSRNPIRPCGPCGGRGYQRWGHSHVLRTDPLCRHRHGRWIGASAGTDEAFGSCTHLGVDNHPSGLRQPAEHLGRSAVRTSACNHLCISRAPSAIFLACSVLRRITPEKRDDRSPAARERPKGDPFRRITRLIGSCDRLGLAQPMREDKMSLGSLANQALGLSAQSATVTRKKVAGMEVASLFGLLFWLLNRASSSFCRSAARPFFSAASNAPMVGP